MTYAAPRMGIGIQGSGIDVQK